MLLSITFILFLVTLSLLAKLRANGLVYGLDFGLFHPDGSLYTFRTLTWLGYTQDEAGIKVSEWYANHAVKANQIDPQSLHFEISPHWEIYQLRLLYPALSMPFVFLMGIPGMLVIPSLSMLTLLISTYFIARNLGSPSLGLFFAAFFLVGSGFFAIPSGPVGKRSSTVREGLSTKSLESLLLHSRMR